MVLSNHVVDAPRDVPAVLRLAQRLGEHDAARQHRVDVRREVLRGQPARQRERRLVRRDGAEQRDVALPQLFLPLRPRQRVLRVERIVGEVEVGAAPHRPGAGHRHDVDEHGPAHAAVVLRGELVHARQANRTDLRLGRELAAGEAVHADRRARRRHRLEHPLHLIGIVGERLDLLAREHGAERRAARVHRRALLVAADGDRFVELLELQGDRAPVIAGADADVADERSLETGELGPDRVPAGLEVFEHRDAERRRLALAPDRRERLVLPLEDDRRLGQDAGRLVHDRDRQARAPRRGLRLRGGRCAENEESDDADDANPSAP